MMKFDITANLESISFSPKSDLEEILQNVKTILTTIKYSVPLDREFGLNADMLDSPLPIAKAKLTAEIFEAVPRYEPRVKVKKVTYETDPLEGKLKPTVKVVIK